MKLYDCFKILNTIDFAQNPQVLVFRAKEVDYFRAIGKFDAKVTAVLVPVNAKGDFQATIGNLDFQITIAVSADDVGYPALSAENCIAESSMDLSISNAGALLDLALNFLKGLIIGQVRPKLESEICRLVTRMINNDANKILHSMPLWVPLDGTANGGLVGRRKRETDIIRYAVLVLLFGIHYVHCD